MYCSKCGTSNADQKKFCTKCGAQLKTLTASVEQASPPQWAQPPAPPQREPERVAPAALPPKREAAEREPRGRIQSLRRKLGIGLSKSEAEERYERGKKIIPDCITPNEGEIPVKQYDVAILRSRIQFAKAEGRLQITNKRILFRAVGRSFFGRISQQHEFNIGEIGGVEIRKDWRFDPLTFFGLSYLCIVIAALFGGICGAIYGSSKGAGIAFAFIFGLAGMIPFFVLKKRHVMKTLTCAASMGSFFGVVIAGAMGGMLSKLLGNSSDGGIIAVTIFGIIAVILYIIAWLPTLFIPNLVILIKSKGASGANGAIEICRDRSKGILATLGFGFKGSEYTGFGDVMPGKDVDKAIKEIGAIISDIQTIGNVEKWKEE